MINQFPLPQLSAAKNRTGMQRLEDLIRCLIVQYDVQARLRTELTPARVSAVASDSLTADQKEKLPRRSNRALPAHQSHFAWYETTRR